LVQYPSIPVAGSAKKTVKIRKNKFFLFSSPSFNHDLSCSDQEPVCGQRDGEEYGGGGTGLQAGTSRHPSISLVGVLLVAVHWEKSNHIHDFSNEEKASFVAILRQCFLGL
jgi:hypothetical protein